MWGGRPYVDFMAASRSAAPTPPPTPLYAADEVTTLRGFLDLYRATLRRQALDLTREQLDRTLPPSPLTLGGLLTHLAFVEHWWFSMVLFGAEPAEPWASVDWEADEDGDFHVAAEKSPEQVLAMFDAAVADAERQLDRALETESIDRLAARARHDGSVVSLRWILVHMIEEYARHCGHADLIRESIDGATDL